MPPPSNVTRTGISLLLRVSISFLLLPPVLSPFSSSPLSSDDERHQRLRIDIYTSRNRPSTEQLPEQPRAHEAATLSRGDPLWKKSLFSSLHVTLRVACLPLRRTMVVGNNHERSKRKRLRTTSITPFFFFSSASQMTLIVIDGPMGFHVLMSSPLDFPSKKLVLLFFFNTIFFISVFRNISFRERQEYLGRIYKYDLYFFLNKLLRRYRN